MSKHKAYLGDSVYVEWDGYYLVLTTENGDGPSNVVMLEPEVVTAFTEYILRISAGQME